MASRVLPTVGVAGLEGGGRPLKDLSRCLPADGTLLRLLGTWSLWHGGAQVEATPSEQRLVVLLALRGRQRRPYLAGILWPDVVDKQALTRLRNTLSSLRRRCPSLLESADDAVSLGSSVLVDVHELEALALDLASRRPAVMDLDAQCELLVGSAELLTGWYDDWVLRERDRINELRIRALEALVEVLLLRDRLAEAAVAAFSAIQLDPLRESSHRALMRVYLAEDNQALAARQVDRYRDILHGELGRAAEPTARMFELVERPEMKPEPPLTVLPVADVSTNLARKRDSFRGELG